MKKTTLALTALLSLPAFGGGYSGSYESSAFDDGSASSPSLLSSLSGPSLSSFFIGGGVSYLWDEFEEPFYFGQIGKSFGNSKIYLESGFVNNDDFGVDFDFIPLTLNYSYETSLSETISWYIGVGAGVGFSDISGPGGSIDDTNFMYQAFTGLSIDLSETVEIFGGVRYFRVDEPFNIGEDLDDIGADLGLRLNF